MQDVELKEAATTTPPKVGMTYVQGGIQRTVLQRMENFPEGYIVDVSLIEVPNGTSAAPHIHPGIEVTYVLEGEFDLVTKGKPDQRFTPGMTYVVTEKDVHFARVISEKPLKTLCVFIHEKTRPVAVVKGDPEPR
jgi:quercetin dioxygenase-like cupin family protein